MQTIKQFLYVTLRSGYIFHICQKAKQEGQMPLHKNLYLFNVTLTLNTGKLIINKLVKRGTNGVRIIDIVIAIVVARRIDIICIISIIIVARAEPAIKTP